MRRLFLLPLWEKVSPKATDEGCSRESQCLTPLEQPSSVSALRADPPSPTRGEGRDATPPSLARRCRTRSPCRRSNRTPRSAV
ncbi:hypothetical protein EOD07_17885 [Mesorhizobium sp. M2C.T.Ca.TU.002.02.1.1]|nr:hypothetical protein EOD07_17885 [Mesorhizobium sp. M2C.T.Ca.TU.002.02.1.1]